MATELLPFDPAEFLNDGESQAEYLSIAFESGNPAKIGHALAVIAKARGGIGTMAAEAGIEPELLADIATGDKDPGLVSVMKIMNALGIRLSAAKVA